MSLLSRLRGAHRAVPVFGVTMILSWGTIFYTPVLLFPLIAKERGWPLAFTMSGISVALVAGGAASPFVGRYIDRYGGHYVMAAGSLLAAFGLAAMPFAAHWLGYYATCAVLGVAMAANLYDPAFATLTRIFGADARKQITLLTLIGGFASTVSWPVTHFLLTVTDWMGVYFIYAWCMALIAAPLHAFAIPRSRAAAPKPSDAKPPATHPPKGLAFLLVAAAFATYLFVPSGVLTHMLLIFERLGIDRGTAVLIGALFGPAQVIARIGEISIARYTHPLHVARFALFLVLIGFLMLLGLGVGPLTAAVFVLMFGAANGLVTIARGTLPLALFGPGGYGHLLGRIAAPSLAFQATAPFAMALVIERFSDHAALGFAALFIVVSLGCFLAIRRPR